MRRKTTLHAKKKHGSTCVKDMMQKALQYPIFISLEVVME